MSFANWRQAQRLKNNVFKWNQWRQSQPNYPITLQRANLHRADLYGANLQGADLQWANLSGANLSDANLNQANLYGADLSAAKLNGADLSDANLCGVTLKRANLRRANLAGADLYGADISEATLRMANLHKVNLQEADLSKASLSGVNLSEVDLSQVNLSGLDLRGADLSQTNLCKAKAVSTRFDKALFTASCLDNWQVNDTTMFDGARCDYVYFKVDQKEHRPKYGIFEPGEFSALFQQTSTIDLVFKDGINWQAFSQAFFDLRSEHAAERYLSIQAIEKKVGNAFVVRLEVPANTDTSIIEHRAQELYDNKLTLIEKQYRAELHAQEEDIIAARELSTNLLKMTELLGTEPLIAEGNQLVTETTQLRAELEQKISDDLESEQVDSAAVEILSRKEDGLDDWA